MLYQLIVFHTIYNNFIFSWQQKVDFEFEPFACVAKLEIYVFELLSIQRRGVAIARTCLQLEIVSLASW